MLAVRLLGVGQALRRFCSSSFCAFKLSRLTGFSRLWAALSCSAKDSTGALGFLEDIFLSALSIISLTVTLRTMLVPAGLSFPY